MRVQFTFPILLLIAANLVPLFGVFFFGWSVGNILILYWLESVLIGLLNIVKILAAKGESAKKPSASSFGGRLFLSIFFTVHYGMFTFVHGVFVADMFDGKAALIDMQASGTLLWVMLGFVLSHGFSLGVNYFGKAEFQTRSPDKQMFAPYGRVIVMHVVILLGGALVMAFGSPIWALIVLIVLKTGIDMTAHHASHRAAAHAKESASS